MIFLYHFTRQYKQEVFNLYHNLPRVHKKDIEELHTILESISYLGRSAGELWQYFQDVIAWVKKIFPNYYKDMLGLDWCHLYNTYHNNNYNSTQMATEVATLHRDDEIQKSKGIYEYLLLKDENLPVAISKLNLRTFSDTEKQRAYDKQGGICPMCMKQFAIEDMRGDHKVPWSKGGKTTEDNLQMLCKDCNLNKSDKY